MTTGRTKTPTTAAECLAVLELAESASTAEIKRAYRRLVRQLHPDKAGGGEGSLTAFLAVVEAYKQLKTMPRTQPIAARAIIPPRVEPRKPWSPPRVPHPDYAKSAIPFAVVVAAVLLVISFFVCVGDAGLDAVVYWNMPPSSNAFVSSKWGALAFSLTIATLGAALILLLGAAINCEVRLQKRQRRWQYERQRDQHEGFNHEDVDQQDPQESR